MTGKTREEELFCFGFVNLVREVESTSLERRARRRDTFNPQVLNVIHIEDKMMINYAVQVKYGEHEQP